MTQSLSQGSRMKFIFLLLTFSLIAFSSEKEAQETVRKISELKEYNKKTLATLAEPNFIKALEANADFKKSFQNDFKSKDKKAVISSSPKKKDLFYLQFIEKDKKAKQTYTLKKKDGKILIENIFSNDDIEN